MGGAGSGGHKNTPGDIETHEAWDLVDPAPGAHQKLRQAKCRHCNKEMAQHTSRQRSHLLTCQGYIEAMRVKGVENSITKQAADPASYINPRGKGLQQTTPGAERRKAPLQKIADFSTAVRIQALALAEARISYDRIREITGVEAKLLEKIRRTAKERGYDPVDSMLIRDEYVADSPKAPVRSRKSQVGEGVGMGEAQPSSIGTVAGYVPAETEAQPPHSWTLISRS